MIYRLPLFPLPNFVLFPRTHVPLHVFEPRYREMMDFAMAGERRLGMAHLREGYEKDYHGAPPIYRVLTAARILTADQLPDGRWSILIEGIERVAIRQEVQTEPFRIAEVTPITEGFPPTERDEVMALMRKIAALAEHVGARFADGRRILTNLVNTHQHPAVVCDVVASTLVMDPYARQSLLEETILHRRMKLLLVQLQSVVHDLRQAGIEIDLPVVE